LWARGGRRAGAAAACAERGARSVHAAATHGVFSGDAVRTLNDSPLASLAVTNTIADIRERTAGLHLECSVLDCTEPFAHAIERWGVRR
jgi:ribose-phosphate pyrophosphokinase